MKYQVLLYRNDMQPIRITGFDNWNEAVAHGKFHADDKYYHGFVIFNQNKEIEYFESF